MTMLLTREDFKFQVFKRDEGKCIICGIPAVDAHHLIDRSLFEEDGGYYLDNGVSLCEIHHYDAELTRISCKELRLKAGITEIIIPEHFDPSEQFDHWGNIVRPNGSRMKGALFFEGNVQKALKEGGFLSDFVPYIKYPRTYHFPDSPNLQNDDRMHRDIDFFNGRRVVATIKMDGENTSLYPDFYHARSVDSEHHESQCMVKALHGQFAFDIPSGFRICGENVYAKHSIHYQHLDTYFYTFSIWNEKNIALSWDDTLLYCDLLNIKTVPVFYWGLWDREHIHNCYLKYCEQNEDPVEGYVVRIEDEIPYGRFHKSTGKWVRSGHVQTKKFWKRDKVISNILEKR